MSKDGYQLHFKKARAARKGSSSSEFVGKKVSDALKKMRPRKSKPIPVLPILSATGLLVGALAAFQNLEVIENWVERFEIKALGLATAQEKKEVSSPTKDESAAKTSSEKSPTAARSSSENNAWTPEQLAFFNKLEERKQQLDARERELQKLDEELQEQKVAIEKRLKDLESLRSRISSRLDEKVKVDQEKVEKLVEFYSNMKPQNAAKVFEDIDEDLAVEILNKMKKKNAADIMNLLKAEKAQKLSEKFAGYKRP